MGGSCSYNTAITPRFGVKGNFHFTSSARNKGRCVGDDGSSEGDCSSLPLCSPTSCAGAEIFLQQRAFPPQTHPDSCLLLCHVILIVVLFLSFGTSEQDHIFRQLIGQPCNRGALRLYARMRHAECLCVCVCVCACVRACVCVCACVCMCVFSHTHTHTHMHIYMTRYVHVRNWKNNQMPCFTNTRPQNS